MKGKKIIRYTGIQPQFFPRLHYFARILQTDIFALRDDVQFVRKHKYPDGKIGFSYQVHSPIKSPNGEFILVVPVIHSGLSLIKDTMINYTEAKLRTNDLTIKHNYKKSLNFEKYYPEIEAIINTQYKSLAEQNIATVFWGLLHLLGEDNVTTDKLNFKYVHMALANQNRFRLRKIVLGSETNAAKDETRFKNEKIVKLIKELGANEDYCGGTAIAAYMDNELFEKNGISIHTQEWKCDEYKQLFTKQLQFIPNLSIVDLLMNTTNDEAISIVGNSR